jgi:cation diffusion facilitator family transporter
VAGDTKHIVQSLIANSAIAIAKGAAAFFTGSGAMLAETLHSTADCGNQVLLLIGVKQSQKVADAKHPLGYGRAAYFWSFMVALLLFAGGGMYSIYEGIHKVMHPEPLERVYIALTILGFSLLVEGAATLSNIKEIKKRACGKPFFRYVRETKDGDLIVVFGENSAATLGLVLAMIALGLAYVTGNPRWDGIGTLAIGLVLVGVAVFLAIEVKSLLLGEAADPEIEIAARDIARSHPNLEAILTIITVQQGPGEVMVALKVRFVPSLTSTEIADTINAFEQALRARCPEARWLFIEPDLAPTAAKPAQAAG